MRARALLREALAAAWAARVPTALVAFVVATMCFVALATVGKAAANEEAFRRRLDAAGARVLTVTDAKAQGFVNARTLSVVSGLDTVQTVIGLSTPQDVYIGRVGPGGARVAAWPVQGDLSRMGRLIAGRMPRPGEALTTRRAQTALGLAVPAGYATTDERASYPVVGAIEVGSPCDDRDGGIIVNANGRPTAREIRVVIDSIDHVFATQRAVLSILGPSDPDGVLVQSPAGLADTAQQLDEQLAGYGRALLVLILGVGAFFVAAVVLSDVLVRRRDLGRRRTLGVGRGDLTTLVTVRTLIPALAGTLIGTGAGLIANVAAGVWTPIDYALAVAVLAVLTAALAALPPGGYAAYRDPVAIMRTP